VASISGGEKLERMLKELAKRVSDPATLRVGFLEGSTYPDGTSVPTVAATQNFGSPVNGIPPRPFFSNMVESKSPGWGSSLAAILKNNRYDVKVSLNLMGEGIAGQLRQSIVDTNSPPLAEKTVARKGFAKPLIENSDMINSVGVEVT
jgi:hypothetical protein